MKKETFETFREFTSYEKSNLFQDKPSAMNNNVRVKKLRITVEEIEEPKEVIEARLSDLYNGTTNFHWKDSIREYCKKHGYSLKIIDQY